MRSVYEVASTLEVSGLEVAYRVRREWRTIVRDVSFEIERGGSFGLVGESGCGKSTVAMAVVRYLAANGRVSAGSVRVDGTDVYDLGPAALREMRARNVGMVYQNPAAALNPSMRVGAQVAEAFEVLGEERETARERARESLSRVQFADPGSVMRSYPHQLSGGMAQRVVIAMALASEPSLLILDEPTTGLDATVAADVLDLVAALRADTGTAVLFISHNLGVIRRMCDRVGVLYAGRLVEAGASDEVFESPRHPYTVGLLRCIPRAGAAKRDGRLDTIPGFLPDQADDVTGCAFAERCAMATDQCRADEPPLKMLGGGRASRCYYHERANDLPRAEPEHVETRARVVGTPLLRLDGVSKTFRHDGVPIVALRDVSLTIRSGETLGLVGESGSGKTTLAKTIAGVYAPDSGATLTFDTQPVGPVTSDRDRRQVRAIQMVFQNPDSSLNPRWSVRGIVARAVRRLGGASRSEARRRAVELTRAVQIADRYLDARPSQLSGGLKQRVAVARAFAGQPRLVLYDEPTTALDVSVQGAILNLLVDLQRGSDIAYLFISHDLGIVRYISDRIAVMYLGEIVELGSAADVFGGPHHPYTETLLSAVAYVDELGRRRIRLVGESPSVSAVPAGCPFHTRCPRVLDVCATERPLLVESQPGHSVRCHLPIEQLGRADGSVPLPQRAAPPE